MPDQNAAGVSGTTLLVIDDDPGVLLLAEEAFAGEGYHVDTAAGGEDALARIEVATPDAILLDIMMPGIDGFETCARIKQMPGLEHVPVIMLTGLEDIEAVERSYQVGAWDFTSKPINWPILRNRVRYALRAADAFGRERESARLSRALDNSPSEVMIIDAATRMVLSANASAVEGLAYGSNEISKISFSHVITDIDDDSLEDILRKTRDNQQAKVNCCLRRKDGSVYPVEGLLLYSSEASPHVYIGIFQDISAQIETEETLHRLEYFDELTGLPNRRLFQEHVDQALSISERHGAHSAICILDLDGFKVVNETLGHSIGDALLIQVAERLGAVVRHYDRVSREPAGANVQAGIELARLGGDEFLILLTDLEDSAAPAKVAARALQQIAEPYKLEDRELTLTGSIGIALYPDDGLNIDDLLMHADTAMYRAKQSGKNSYVFYSQEDDDSSLERLDLETQLRSAIVNKELVLHFQPQVDSSLQRIVGAESLLRWQHPQKGLLFPGSFIEIAESSGIILPIGEWVLEQAVMQLDTWSGQLSDDFKLSVNVSALQLRQERFLALARTLLHDHPAACGKLVIELTESAVMSSAESRIEWLQDMKSIGAKIAIDDFGTGYSSLNYLKKFPIDYLKIDRSFVIDVEENREDSAIVRAIFSLAQALDLGLIVEGVETAGQLSVMRSMGDCEIQGWLVSRALPLEEFDKFLADYRNGPAGD